MPNKNRDKGNNFERIIAREFRDLGFANCETSRYASKKTDDMKVDLMFTEPFNVQAKAWKAAPSYHKTLKEMPEDTNYNIIIHRRPRQGDVVVIDKKDFYEIVEMLLLAKVL
jgi:hypothetical protein